MVQEQSFFEAGQQFEIGSDAHQIEPFAQNAGAERVKGGDPAFIETSGVILHDAGAKFPGGFIRERQGQDLFHADAFVEELADQHRDRSGFPGSGAGDDQGGPFEAGNDGLLLGVEPIKIVAEGHGQ